MDDYQGITVSARMINHSLVGARRQAIDIDRLLMQSGIATDVFSLSSARIPVENVVRFIKLCSYTMNDESFGLLEKPFRVGYLRMLAISVLSARSLGQALHRMTEFRNLFDNSLQMNLKLSGSKAELTADRIPGHRILDNYAVDSTMSTTHRFCGWLCNERILLDRVDFDFPAPDYRKEFHYIFYGAPVLFEQSRNRIVFDASYLERKIVQNETSVENYARRAPLDLYLHMDGGGVVTQTVRKLTMDAFASAKGEQAPSLEQISEAMDYQPHTLRRRLKEEGTSFNTIRSQVRRDIAIHYLGNPEPSIEKIAIHTGYTEPSAFIRAFKTWTGFTPLQFRKGLETGLEPL